MTGSEFLVAMFLSAVIVAAVFVVAQVWYARTAGGLTEARPEPQDPSLTEEVRALIHMTTFHVQYYNAINAWLIMEPHDPEGMLGGRVARTIYMQVAPHASFSEWQGAMANAEYSRHHLQNIPRNVYIGS